MSETRAKKRQAKPQRDPLGEHLRDWLASEVGSAKPTPEQVADRLDELATVMAATQPGSPLSLGGDRIEAVRLALAMVKGEHPPTRFAVEALDRALIGVSSGRWDAATVADVRRYAETIRTAADEPDAEPPSFTVAEQDVFRALGEAVGAVTNDDLRDESGRSDKTCREAVKKFIAAGLAERPGGGTRRVKLTKRGRTFYQNLLPGR